MTKREREELVATIVSMALLMCSADPRKPGLVIKKLMPYYGDKIKELTSDDFKDMRIK